MNEQPQVLSSSLIIPFDKIKKYRHLITLSQIGPTPHLIQLRESLQTKPKTVYSAYSSQSLIKLLRVIQANSYQFMQIHAINTTISKNNKKDFLIDKLLREYCEFSYQELLEELRYIRQQLRDKDLYREFLQWIKLVLSKIKYLLYKHCEVLISVLGECINFYIRRIRTTQDNYQYSVILGFDKICVSFCSSNQYSESIMLVLLGKLRQRCAMDGYDMMQGEFSLRVVEMGQTNLFDKSELPEYLFNAYQRKDVLVEGKMNSLLGMQNSDSDDSDFLTNNTPASDDLAELIYTHRLLNTLTKYAQDIFLLIQGTIVFLSNLVLEKKQLKSIAYDQQFISMKHPLQEKTIVEETFMNLYCEHFEGLPEELYQNGGKCPYCSQPIIVDEVKCYQRNRNLFQNLLKRNFLNPNRDNVVYYFKDRIFTLATKDKFSSYVHYCEFIKKRCFLRDRPDTLMLLQSQKISLYNKLWGKKKLFSSHQLITTPVRGKYCRHLQFFQLIRVYQKYRTRKQHQTSFECFLCFEPVQFDEIIYLHEIKLLIDLVRFNFYSNPGCLLNAFVEVSHERENVVVGCQLEKGYMRRVYELPIYHTLVDPLTKSQKGLSEGKNKKKQQVGEFQYTQEFSYFFFGF